MRTITLLIWVTVVAISLGCEKKSRDAAASSAPDGGNVDGEAPTDDGSGDPGHVVISGSLAVGADLDAAVPFPLSGPKINGGEAAGTPPTPITSGTIAVSVSGGAMLDDDKGGSTVLMLMKEGETLLDAFESMVFVGAPTSADDTLINLATSSAKVDVIELGEIAPVGEDMVAANTLGTAQFDVEADALAEMAKIDDSLRILKNQYANTQPHGGNSVQGVLEFYWSGDVTDAVNVESAPAALVFDGWSPALHFNHDEFTFDALCDATVAGFKAFSFAIPAPGVKRNVADAAYITALTNAGAVPNSVPALAGRPDCGAGSGASNSYIAGGGAQDRAMYMNFGGGEPFQTAIPKGTWTVTLAGEVKAKFDLGLSYPLVDDPVDATKKVPRVYVPAFKITADAATKKVEKVEVRFYLYDRSSRSYGLVTDYATMKQTVQGVTFDLSQTDSGGSSVTERLPQAQSEEFPADGEAWVMDVTKFANEWRVGTDDRLDCPDPSGAKKVDMLVLDYIMAENRYKFSLSLPTGNPQGVGCPP